MRKCIRVIAICIVVFGLASLLSLYAYGRFAERARGEPAYALPVEPAATRLDRAIEPLTSAHPQQTGLTLIGDNVDAFAIRAATARGAGRSLDLQYYLWHDDLSGRLLMGEVLAAADRGVRVRLLLDDINAHGADAATKALSEHPNIEVRMFNPSWARQGSIGRAFELLTRGWSLNRRMHNKAWIADGRIAIVGGRNVGDEYFDAAMQMNFLDADLAVIGPAVAQAEAIFDAFWNSDAVLPIEALSTRTTLHLEILRARLESVARTGTAQPYVEHLQRTHDPRLQLFRTRPLHWSREAAIHSDPPDKTGDRGTEQWLVDALAPALGAARRELKLISPYFVPGDAGIEWLAATRARGVEVAVLTNSLAATDVFAVHGGYAHARRPLLEAGVVLYELMPFGTPGGSLFGSSGASLHTKAFMVDGETGFVGSLNFDPRSINLNTEMGVLFRSPALTAELLRTFDEKAAAGSSYRLFLADGKLRWEDGREDPPTILDREPEAGIWRRIGARVVGWLPVESQL